MGQVKVISFTRNAAAKRETIVIVGGGRESVHGIRKAKEMGLDVVLTDGDENCPGAQEEVLFVKASTYNPEETIEELRKVRLDFHGVMSVAADVPFTVASVAHEFGVNGIPLDAALALSDKVAMKQVLSASGLRIPWFEEVSSPIHLQEILDRGRKSLIVKPVDSRGARGVVRLLAGVEPSWAFEEARKNSPTSRVMVEEFLEGPQLSSESIIHEGSVITVGLSDRNYDKSSLFAPFVIEDGGQLPSHIDEETRTQVDSLIRSAARAFSLDNCTIKGDIVLHRGKPTLIEVAPRLSGGLFSSHEIPISTGVDLLGIAIELALGRSPELPGRRLPAEIHVAQRYLMPEQGTVVRVDGLDHVQSLEFVEVCEIYVGPGDTILPQTSHPARAGMVIATGPTREVAVERAEAAISTIDVVIRTEY